ncbi:MAG: radical SAM protein, partial [Betaproteobacteria bacterium]|nr:radical SAM protein [Betaproteobacteria bacterium]
MQRRPAKGRGALSQLQHRFSTDQREPFDDGWAAAEPAEPGSADEPPPLRTQVTLESARSILGSNDSPDIYFDRSINPYRGCEHGCIYCYARPTHAYLD